MNEPKTPSEGFLLEEYKRLCLEVDHYIKESGNCVTYSVASSGALWAWFVTNEGWHRLPEVVYLPSILCFIWFVRWACLQRGMGHIGDYLEKVEGQFLSRPKAKVPQQEVQLKDAQLGDDEPHGWQTLLGTIKQADSPNGWKRVWYSLPKCVRRPFGSLGWWGAVAFVGLIAGNLKMASFAKPVGLGVPKVRFTDEQIQDLAAQLAQTILSTNSAKPPPVNQQGNGQNANASAAPAANIFPAGTNSVSGPPKQ